MSTIEAPRRLNHMEFVHRPGERALVLELFALLGFEPHDGMFLVGAIDPERHNLVDNILAGSEVRPEQWAFDQALAEAMRSGPLAATYAGYQELLDRAPQWGMHVGIRFDSLAEWEATVARVADVGAHAPALDGRVRLCGVFRPGDPGSVSDLVHQAFVWTDVLACGSLALGQHLELQHADMDRLAASRAG
jgi:hypothetical protein